MRVKYSDLEADIKDRVELREVYVSRLKNWINDSLIELYDEISGVAPEYFAKLQPSDEYISIEVGRDRYPLPKDCADVLRVDVQYSTDEWIPISRANRHDIVSYWLTGPTEAATFRLLYEPDPPQFNRDADEIDFGWRWKDYIIADCHLKHAEKEDSDTEKASAIMRKEKALKRILERSAPMRDRNEPSTIRDVYRTESRIAHADGLTYSTKLSYRYRIMGSFMYVSGPRIWGAA